MISDETITIALCILGVGLLLTPIIAFNAIRLLAITH